MEIRPVEPAEYDALGAITVAAYASVDGYHAEPDYEVELAAVAERAAAPHTAVLVAVEGGLLGGVTYIDGPASPLAEHDDPHAAGIRMLAVDPAAQGRGVGEALVRACIDRARASGRDQVVLHSTQWMETAHRLYQRLGFVRDASLDWTPVPRIELMGFRRTVDR